jgi:hypothetical protein
VWAATHSRTAPPNRRHVHVGGREHDAGGALDHE